MAKNVLVTWVQKRQFVGSDSAKHSIVISSKDEDNNTGVKPSDLLLMALGSCSAYDVVTILEKSRQKVSDCRVELSAERADEIPAVFTKIHLHFVVSGEDLNPKQVERAVSMSAQKYCSASIMLAKAGVEITHDFEIC